MMGTQQGTEEVKKHKAAGPDKTMIESFRYMEDDNRLLLLYF